MALVSCDLLVGLNAFEILSSIAVIMTSSREKGKMSSTPRTKKQSTLMKLTCQL